MWVQQIAKVLQQASWNSGKPQLIYHIWIWLSFPPQHALPLCSSTIVVFHFPACFVARLLQSAVQSLIVNITNDCGYLYCDHVTWPQIIFAAVLYFMQPCWVAWVWGYCWASETLVIGLQIVGSEFVFISNHEYCLLRCNYKEILATVWSWIIDHYRALSLCLSKHGL